MNISSTPFIRNDYWPDYNDINQLNQRIDEAENEISLVNVRLSADIENVSNNLNTYANKQANTTVANNVIVNNLNANYAEGRFANFDNTFTNNAYIENLTVNKPVFDITLNTPHLENTTSLGGNFYNANLFDVNLSGDISGNLNDININNLLANTATIPNLFVDISPAPLTSSAVLGYDEQGRVIPVHAVFDPSFPEDADYLWTDHSGTARKGVRATEIGAVENLITAYGVKNAIDTLNAEVLDNFNVVTGALNDIDAWQNSFENSVANSFSDVANTFNEVNNFVNDSLNDVNNTFNDVNNTFNDVNNYVSDNFNNLNNSFDNIENDVSNLNNTTNNLSNNLDSLLIALGPLLNMSVANVSGWRDSTSPVNIQGITEFKVAPFAAASMTGSAVGDGAKLNVSGTVATLALPGFQWTKDSMYTAFKDCHLLNSNVQLPNGVTDMSFTFDGCTNLNQNILIPNGVTNMYATFIRCTSFNQNILIPNSVTDMSSTFDGCTKLNQNILIPNSVTDMSFTFNGCTKLNQNILIPNSVTSMEQCFFDCTNLNQNILIPNSVTNMTFTFGGCTNLNQNILIPNSVDRLDAVFKGCTNFNRSDVYIYSQNAVKHSLGAAPMENAFLGCHINNIHVPTSVPKATSNTMYNCLVNGVTGITFPAANIFNDLPVDIEQWPPV